MFGAPAHQIFAVRSKRDCVSFHPMTHFICEACGTQFRATSTLPGECPICTDSRQFVPSGGQRWTDLDALRSGDRRNIFHQHDDGLLGIGTTPEFAIGQRALLVCRPEGNVLWDCIPLLDDAALTIIEALGGISAIAISHPHFYSTMIEWSRAFGNAPIYLHADDRAWVMRPDPAIIFWESETCASLGAGLTLVRCGGHFAGAQVLHWSGGGGGQGAVLSGDVLQVVADRRWVSFLYSYPNLIPLPAAAVRRIGEALAPFAFERLYGAWWGKCIASGAKNAVEKSVERYANAVGPVAGS
jgi:hypothetical protein